MAVITSIQFKRGHEDALNKWAAVPLAGEPIFDLDNAILKIGDGVHTYEELKAVGGEGGGPVSQIVFDDYFNFPNVGKINILYIAKDKQRAYIWDGPDATNARYVEIASASDSIIDGGGADKTRIILRNDSASAWAAVAESAILHKGEVGIEFDPSADAAHKVRMKIGDGKSSWGTLDYFGESPEQRLAKTYQVDIEAGADKVAAITVAVGSDELRAGDIAIVREAIHSGDKKQYTAFVYSGTAWAAMDGNYNAENVYFADDLTYTANIGVRTVPSSGSGTIDAAGKNIKEVLASILAERKDPTVTAPSASITLNQAGAKEAGTKVTPTYTAKLNAGSYTYGPATGIVASTYSVTDGVTGHEAQTGATGAFPEIQVTDGMSYKLTASISYKQGAIPKDNLGNEKPDLRIAAGSKSATSSAITAYRNSFYGSVTDKTAALDSAAIRALSGKSGKTNAVGNTFNAPEAVGAMRVIIAVPAPRTCTSIKDVNGLNAEALSAFTKTTMQVEGANGYAAKEYNVYYKDNAGPCDKANNWAVTLG